MSCGCPSGYILVDGVCVKTVYTPLERSRLPQTPPRLIPSGEYMTLGTPVFDTISPAQFPLVYESEFPLVYRDAQAHTHSPVSTIIGGNLWISEEQTDRGRLNQAGVGLLPPLDEWQGYNYCISVGNGDIISVAVSSTFAFRITIDGDIAVLAQPLPPFLPQRYLQVFPFELPGGKHNILVEGFSGEILEDCGQCLDEWGGPTDCQSQYALTPPENCPNLGVFLVEIYRNVTAQILSSIQDQANLTQVYALSCANTTGQYASSLISRAWPYDTGVNGMYLCRNLLDFCQDGALFCRQTLEESLGSCCFTLVNCQTGATLVTNTNLLSVANKALTLVGRTGCYIVQSNSTVPCPGPVTVVVDETFDTCQECTTVFYKLTDCQGVATPVYTTTDLFEYIGDVIQIQGQNVCWIVSEWERQDEYRDVVITNHLEGCQECSG